MIIAVNDKKIFSDDYNHATHAHKSSNNMKCTIILIFTRHAVTQQPESEVQASASGNWEVLQKSCDKQKDYLRRHLKPEEQTDRGTRFQNWQISACSMQIKCWFWQQCDWQALSNSIRKHSYGTLVYAEKDFECHKSNFETKAAVVR